eukprot:scaffold107382_cov78-Phaeocystis_antarctica.AAC.1
MTGQSACSLLCSSGPSELWPARIAWRISSRRSASSSTSSRSANITCLPWQWPPPEFCDAPRRSCVKSPSISEPSIFATYGGSGQAHT